MMVKIKSIEASWNDRFPKTNGHDGSSSGNRLPSPALSQFHLKSPVILRGDAFRDALEMTKLPTDIYRKLASCIKRVGGALLATVDDLADVSLRELPIRIAPIYSDSVPDSESLSSADAIEFQLGHWNNRLLSQSTRTSLRSLQLDWPWDTPDLLRLAKKVELIRTLSHGLVPIGITIPISDPSEASLRTFQWLAEIGVDYVTLRTAVSCLGSKHPALEHFPCDPVELASLAKKLFTKSADNALVIVVEYPWLDGYQAGQAILAGASLVGIDGYMAKFVPNIADLLKHASSDTLASGVYSRSSVQPIDARVPTVSKLFENLDLDSALGGFVSQLESSLEYSL